MNESEEQKHCSLLKYIPKARAVVNWKGREKDWGSLPWSENGSAPTDSVTVWTFDSLGGK